MTIAELLTELAQRGVRLSALGDDLEIRAPKGILTPTLREQLSRDKESILRLIRQRDAAPKTSSFPVVNPDPANRYQPFPLTDIQQAYWVGRSASFELGNVSIHMYTEIDCIGLDLCRFSDAWQRVIERHDMLRAVLLPDGQQKILERVPRYDIQVLDLREAAASDVDLRIEEVRAALSHQVLPIDRWPAFEIRASRLTYDRYRIHISIDCLNIDGASLMLLFSDWITLYRKPETELPKLELSYRDYVLAERELRHSETYRRALEYWRKRVLTLPPAPDVPTAKNPGALTKPHFTHRGARLDRETWRRLKDLTIERGLTPSSALLTAYAEVLNTWSKDPQFTVNVTLFNRLPVHPQIDAILGDFTSMILLKADLSQDEPFTERVRRVQKQLWADLEYRNVSGVEALREFAKVQGRSSGAVMPIVFTSFLNLNPRGFEAPLTSLGDLGTVIYQITQTPQVWLDHQVFEESGSLVLNWEAVDEIFPEGLLDDMFASYCGLLNRLAAGECWDQSVLPLVPPAHISQREEINRTDAPVPSKLLQTFFEDHVKLHGEQPAVITSDTSVSYRELSKLSNQLGHRLRALGVAPDEPVAVVMERGWEPVVAVLGIIKAGAAYLPIDADFPPARIEFLLRSGNVRVAVTQPRVRAACPALNKVTALVVDSAGLVGVTDAALQPVQRPHNLAYLLYTSGSTGTPKGAMIEQRSVVNRMVDVVHRFRIRPDDCAMALTALHHDLSVFDIFGVLCVAGGSLVVPDANLTRDPSHWARLMVEHRVTVWNSVPSFLDMLVTYLESSATCPVPASLRWVILSGDFIPLDLPDRLRRLLPKVEVTSAGGPTETTVWDICYPIGTIDPSWKSIPYGRPMANAHYYVLDHRLQPRPVWVPGELHIGGAGLARAYWNDEQRTAESFITHPATGERLYRSGDLGRYLPDGNIEILGRKDLQVKIRGYRVEVGEIESVLAQHPEVRSAAVTAIGEGHTNKRLVAYVAPHSRFAGAASPAGANAAAQSSFVPGQTEGVLSDPLARIDFKMQKRQLRQALPGQVRISLIKPEIDETLRRQYVERQSYRSFLQHPVPFAKLSAFLGSISELQLTELPLPKYRYASAGGLYPVQVYLYVKSGRVENLLGGAYYYHPTENCLVRLSADTAIDRSVHHTVNQAIFDSSAFSLFLIGELDAITPMYGEMARDFCVLEAGYMSQLLMMAGPDSGIGLCPIGFLDFEKIRGLFQLRESQILLHSHLGGSVDPSKPQAVSIPHLEDWRALSSSPARGDEALIAELRNHLSERLPEYMVPPTFVVLDSLPLNANGKVDRKALPTPERREISDTAKRTGPETELERSIAEVLRQILGVAAVGVNDNLFDLGANSVHIVQANSRLREILKREFSVVEMFKHPTVSALASFLSDHSGAESGMQETRQRAQKQIEAMSRQKKRQERYRNG